jgi:hypothetical protein
VFGTQRGSSRQEIRELTALAIIAGEFVNVLPEEREQTQEMHKDEG